MFICLLDELILGFCYSDLTLETGGFELASTITLVLQANRLTKCASHPNSGKKCIDRKLDNPQMIMNCFTIFKIFSARCADYLEAADLHKMHKGRSTCYLCPVKFYGHRWVENLKSIIGIIEIWENLRRYFEWFQLQKNVSQT